MQDRRIGEWKITKKIGSGSFGDIFLGYNVRTAKCAAVKIERNDTKHPQLLHEYSICKALFAGSERVVGVPAVFYFEKLTTYSGMVMELLGPSLEDLFNFCKRKFSVHTVLMLADQLIRRMEFVHNKNILHRDIKPDNFLLHSDPHIPIIYLIDFGLSKSYRSNNEHIPYRENKLLTGTARYASINTHLGIEQSRRDDLESLGYVLLYLLRGELPWQGIQARTKTEKYDLIMDCKVNTPVETLTEGREEFQKYIHYCRSLHFTDTPDYKYLRDLFINALRRDNLPYDFNFDWLSCDTTDTPERSSNNSMLMMSSVDTPIAFESTTTRRTDNFLYDEVDRDRISQQRPEPRQQRHSPRYNQDERNTSRVSRTNGHYQLSATQRPQNNRAYGNKNFSKRHSNTSNPKSNSNYQILHRRKSEKAVFVERAISSTEPPNTNTN